MDAVQKFISENQHQFGYIMHEASRQWIEKDKIGALTVGNCNLVIERHGEYHEVLEKMEKYEETLRNIDKHIRSTPDPVQYIVKELKSALPEYKDDSSHL